jgi:hypothetical protein
MRARSTWLTAVALFVIGGCNAGLPAFGDGTAPPRGPTRPPVTAPAIVATPPPSSAPNDPSSPPVEPAPGDVGTDSVTFAELRKHLRRSYRDMKPAFKAIERTAEARNRRGLVQAVAGARAWADKEHAWLNSHTPATCIRPIYDVWRDAVAVMRDGLTVMDDAFDPLDPAEFMRGLELLEQAGAILKEHPGMLAASPCTNDRDGAHG